MRVLIVEDEPFIALDLQAILTAAGYEVVGIVGSSSEVKTALERGGVEIVILDGNLQGESAAPLAERLRGDGIPFLVVSGYASDQLEWLGDARLIGKPFLPQQLLDALAGLRT
jgi:DNA-binding response OmpR family regulator